MSTDRYDKSYFGTFIPYSCDMLFGNYRVGDFKILYEDLKYAKPTKQNIEDSRTPNQILRDEMAKQAGKRKKFRY